MVLKNKKGQGMSTEFIVVVIILVIVAIIVIGFIYYFNKKATETVELVVPSAISAKVQQCRVALSTSDYNTYCINFGEATLVGSNKQGWINCEYPDVQKGLVALDIPLGLKCDDGVADDFCKRQREAVGFKGSLILDKNNKQIACVPGIKCSEAGGTQFETVLKSKGCSTGFFEVTDKTINDLPSNDYTCCIKT